MYDSFYNITNVNDKVARTKEKPSKSKSTEGIYGLKGLYSKDPTLFLTMILFLLILAICLTAFVYSYIRSFRMSKGTMRDRKRTQQKEENRNLQIEIRKQTQIFLENLKKALPETTVEIIQDSSSIDSIDDQLADVEKSPVSKDNGEPSSLKLKIPSDQLYAYMNWLSEKLEKQRSQEKEEAQIDLEKGEEQPNLQFRYLSMSSPGTKDALVYGNSEDRFNWNPNNAKSYIDQSAASFLPVSLRRKFSEDELSTFKIGHFREKYENLRSEQLAIHRPMHISNSEEKNSTSYPPHFNPNRRKTIF